MFPYAFKQPSVQFNITEERWADGRLSYLVNNCHTVSYVVLTDTDPRLYSPEYK
jgi:hypothetical protein